MPDADGRGELPPTLATVSRDGGRDIDGGRYRLHPRGKRFWYEYCSGHQSAQTTSSERTTLSGPLSLQQLAFADGLECSPVLPQAVSTTCTTWKFYTLSRSFYYLCVVRSRIIHDWQFMFNTVSTNHVSQGIRTQSNNLAIPIQNNSSPLCEGGLGSSVSSIKRLLPRPLRLLVGVINVYGAFAIVLTVLKVCHEHIPVVHEDLLVACVSRLAQLSKHVVDIIVVHPDVQKLFANVEFDVLQALRQPFDDVLPGFPGRCCTSVSNCQDSHL
jgi:hypothetical protein